MRKRVALHLKIATNCQIPKISSFGDNSLGNLMIRDNCPRNFRDEGWLTPLLTGPHQAWSNNWEYRSDVAKYSVTRGNEEFRFNSYTRAGGLNDSDRGLEYRPNNTVRSELDRAPDRVKSWHKEQVAPIGLDWLDFRSPFSEVWCLSILTKTFDYRM